MEELWRFLRTKRLYTKSYEDFQQQFSSQEKLELLRTRLVQDKHIKANSVEEMLTPYEGTWTRKTEEAAAGQKKREQQQQQQAQQVAQEQPQMEAPEVAQPQLAKPAPQAAPATTQPATPTPKPKTSFAPVQPEQARPAAMMETLAPTMPGEFTGMREQLAPLAPSNPIQQSMTALAKFVGLVPEPPPKKQEIPSVVELPEINVVADDGTYLPVELSDWRKKLEGNVPVPQKSWNEQLADNWTFAWTGMLGSRARGFGEAIEIGASMAEKFGEVAEKDPLLGAVMGRNKPTDILKKERLTRREQMDIAEKRRAYDLSPLKDPYQRYLTRKIEESVTKDYKGLGAGLLRYADEKAAKADFLSLQTNQEGFWALAGQVAPYTVGTLGAIMTGYVSAPAAAVVGAASMTDLSLISFGSGIEAYDRYKLDSGQKIDPDARIGVGLMYAAGETIGESIALDYFMPKGLKGKLGQTLFGGLSGEVQEQTAAGIIRDYARSSTKRAKIVAGLKSAVTGSGVEAGSELITQNIQDFTDYLYTEREDAKSWRELADGQLKAIKGGALMGFFMGPLSFGAQLQQYRQIRNKRGKVFLAQNKATGESVEILEVSGKDNKGNNIYRVIRPNGTETEVNQSDIGESVELTTSQFYSLLRGKNTGHTVVETAQKPLGDPSVPAPQMGERVNLPTGGTAVISSVDQDGVFTIEDEEGNQIRITREQLDPLRMPADELEAANRDAPTGAEVIAQRMAPEGDPVNEVYRDATFEELSDGLSESKKAEIMNAHRQQLSNVLQNGTIVRDIQNGTITQRRAQEIFSSVGMGFELNQALADAGIEVIKEAEQATQQELVTQRDRLTDELKNMRETPPLFETDAARTQYNLEISDKQAELDAINEQLKQIEDAKKQQGVQVRPEGEQVQGEGLGNQNLPEGDGTVVQDRQAAEEEVGDLEKPFIQRIDGSGPVKVTTTTKEEGGIRKITFEQETTTRAGIIGIAQRKDYNNMDEAAGNLGIVPDSEMNAAAMEAYQGSVDSGQSPRVSVYEVREDMNTGQRFASIGFGGERVEVELKPRKAPPAEPPAAPPTAPAAETPEAQAIIEKGEQQKAELGRKQIERGFNNLDKATDPIDRIKAIHQIETNVQQGARLTSDEQAKLEAAKAQLESEGYEVRRPETYNTGDAITINASRPYDGTILSEGQVKHVERAIAKAERRGVEFDPGEAAIVSRVDAPMILKDGKLVAAGEVSTMVFESREQAEEAMRISREAGFKKKTQADKIDEKTNAELAALRGKGPEPPGPAAPPAPAAAPVAPQAEGITQPQIQQREEEAVLEGIRGRGDEGQVGQEGAELRPQEKGAQAVETVPVNVAGRSVDYSVERDAAGAITRITDAQGNEIPPTVTTTRKGLSVIKPNPFYTKVRNAADGTMTDAALRKERDEVIRRNTDVPFNAQAAAERAVLQGAKVSRESLRKEVGPDAVKLSWHGMAADNRLPSIERLSEMIWDEVASEMGADPSFSQQDVRNALIDLYNSSFDLESVKEGAYQRIMREQGVYEDYTDMEAMADDAIPTPAEDMSPEELQQYYAQEFDNFWNSLTDEQRTEYVNQLDETAPEPEGAQGPAGPAVGGVEPAGEGPGVGQEPEVEVPPFMAEVTEQQVADLDRAAKDAENALQRERQKLSQAEAAAGPQQMDMFGRATQASMFGEELNQAVLDQREKVAQMERDARAARQEAARAANQLAAQQARQQAQAEGQVEAFAVGPTVTEQLREKAMGIVNYLKDVLGLGDRVVIAESAEDWQRMVDSVTGGNDVLFGVLDDIDLFAGDVSAAKKFIDHVFSTVSEADAKAAYRKMSFKYHPDRPGGATEVMQYLNDAWDKYSQGGYKASTATQSQKNQSHQQQYQAYRSKSASTNYDRAKKRAEDYEKSRQKREQMAAEEEARRERFAEEAAKRKAESEAAAKRNAEELYRKGLDSAAERFDRAEADARKRLEDSTERANRRYDEYAAVFEGDTQRLDALRQGRDADLQKAQARFDSAMDVARQSYADAVAFAENDYLLKTNPEEHAKRESARRRVQEDRVARERQGKERNFHFKTDASGIVGFVYNGRMYLNPERISPESVLHENQHLWQEGLKASAKDGDDTALAVMQKRENLFGSIADKLIAGERISDELGVDLTNPVYDRRDGETDEQYRNRVIDELEGYAVGRVAAGMIPEKGVWTKIADYVRSLADWLARQAGFKGKTPERIMNMTMDEYARAAGISAMKGEFFVSANPVVREIKALPLTRVRGLKMGRSEAEGAYISTERVNRYADMGTPLPVDVDIKNPIKTSERELFQRRRDALPEAKRRFLNRLSEADRQFLEKQVNAAQSFDSDELAVPYMMGFAGDLAQAVTDSYVAEGYDSVFIPETPMQEGMLIVFDRSKVKTGGMLASVDMLNIVDGWYSPIEKRIRETKIEKQSANKWLTGGFIGKGDEAIYTGVKGWLESKDPQEQVSKRELLDFMRDNRVEIKLIVKGKTEWQQTGKNKWERPTTRMTPTGRLVPEGKVVITKIEDKYYGLPTTTKFQRTFDSLEQAMSYYDSVGGFSGTQYYEHILPGSKMNYREVLVTMPVKVTPSLVLFNPIKHRPIIEYLTGLDNSATEDEILKQTEGLLTKSKEDLISMAYKAYDRMLPENASDVEKSNARFRRAEVERVIKSLPVTPEIRGTEYESQHWSEKNILVHVRMDIRQDADGGNVLFVEEIQSDWGQEGKKIGFGPKYEVRKVEGGYGIFNRETNQQDDSELVFEKMQTAEKWMALDSVYRESGAPLAPFVTDTNAWTKLGAKIAIREAIKQGADKIAWTTGEQQNNRYDLSKQVDSINWKRDSNGNYSIRAEKDGNVVAKDSGMNAAKLESAIGKDAAEKIVNNADSSGILQGADLAVGGKGMKAFYDGIVPGAFKAAAKEIAGQPAEVVSATIDADGPSVQQAIDVTPQLVSGVSRGVPMFMTEQQQATQQAMETAKAAFPNVDVTSDIAAVDAAKQVAVERGELQPGQNPLGFVVDGEVFIDPRVATPETVMHEYGHVWSTWLKINDTAKHRRGLELMRGTVYEARVRNNPGYAGKSDYAVLEEALAQAIGEKAGALWTDRQKMSKFRKWLDEMWNAIRSYFGGKPIEHMTMEEFVDKAVKDLVYGGAASPATSKDIARAEAELRPMFLEEKTAAHALGPLMTADMARRMEAQGRDMASIEATTGWIKGPDGKWRAHMDWLVETSLKKTPAAGDTLGDIIDSPSMFEAFPEAKDIPVILQRGKFKAAYSFNGTILINPDYMGEDLVSNIYHETQHYFQHREGFIYDDNTTTPTAAEAVLWDGIGGFPQEWYDYTPNEVQYALQKMAEDLKETDPNKAAMATLLSQLHDNDIKDVRTNIYLSNYAEIMARAAAEGRAFYDMMESMGFDAGQVWWFRTAADAKSFAVEPHKPWRPSGESKKQVAAWAEEMRDAQERFMDTPAFMNMVSEAMDAMDNNINSFQRFSDVYGFNSSFDAYNAWMVAKQMRQAMTGEPWVMQNALNFTDFVIQQQIDDIAPVRDLLSWMMKETGVDTSGTLVDLTLYRSAAEDAIARTILSIWGPLRPGILGGRPTPEEQIIFKEKDSLYARAKEDGIGINELGLYMALKHAPFRNARVREMRSKLREEYLNKLQEAMDIATMEGKANRAEAIARVMDEVRANNYADTVWNGKYAEYHAANMVGTSEINNIDNGAGITDAEAAERMNALAPTPEMVAKYDAYAQEIRDKLIVPRLNATLEAGIITPEQHAALMNGTKEGYETVLEHYVPLNVQDELLGAVTDTTLGGGAGTGIYSLVGTAEYSLDTRYNPIASLSAQYLSSNRLIARNNMIKQMASDMTKAASAMAARGKVSMYKINSEGDFMQDAGTLQQDGSMKYFKGDARRRTEWIMRNSIGFYSVNGRRMYITFPAHVDKDGNVQQHPVVHAMKNETVPTSDLMTKLMQVQNAWMNFKRMTITQLNPFFSIPNFERDNIGKFGMLGVFKDVKVLETTFRSIARGGSIRTTLALMDPFKMDKETSMYYDEYQRMGGFMSWVNRSKLAENAKDWQKLSDELGTAYHQAFFGIGAKNPKEAMKQFLATYKNLATKSLDVIGTFNDAMENGTRLATYISLRQQGVSAKNAAYVAKEVTINFEKKGEWAKRVGNNLYLFYSVAMQGAYNGIRMVKSPKVWAMFGIVGGVSAMLRSFAYMMTDDDEEKRDEFMRHVWTGQDNQYWLLHNPWDETGTPIRIVKPYGPFRPISTIAEGMIDVAMETKTVSQVAAESLGSIYAAFVPMFGEVQDPKNIVTTIVPDVPTAKPLAEIFVNADWTGRSIIPEYGPKTEEGRAFRQSELYTKNTNPFYVQLMKGLEENTRSEGARVGWGDLSPAAAEHFVKSFAPGVITKAADAVFSFETPRQLVSDYFDAEVKPDPGFDWTRFPLTKSVYVNLGKNTKANYWAVKDALEASGKTTITQKEAAFLDESITKLVDGGWISSRSAKDARKRLRQKYQAFAELD